MGVKHKILKLEVAQSYDHNGEIKKRLTGFVLDGVVGTVDPFIDGNFIVPELQNLRDGEYIEAELAWATSQVGKFLHCDELSYIAAFTIGKVEIK